MADRLSEKDAMDIDMLCSQGEILRAGAALRRHLLSWKVPQLLVFEAETEEAETSKTCAIPKPPHPVANWPALAAAGSCQSHMGHEPLMTDNVRFRFLESPCMESKRIGNFLRQNALTTNTFF